MSIATAIQAAQQKVANAYAAVSNKGGTLPATQNLSNLPTAINSIQAGGNITSLSVYPSVNTQTITPPSGVDGYAPVTVHPVTSSIDSNIKPENIKEDVTILGVTGTFAGGGGGSKYGVVMDNIFGNVNSSGALQDPTPPAAMTFTGVKTISINYVLSYKFYHKSLSGTAISFPDLTSISGQYALEYAFNSNSASVAGPASISFPKLTSVTGMYSLRYAFSYGRMTSVSFPELTQITGNSAFYYAFTRCSYINSLSFPKLTSVAQSGLAYAFYYNLALTEVEFPKLKTFLNNSALQGAFGYCSNLETVTFTSLDTMTYSSGLANCFTNCTKLKDVYFPALKTTSFGTGQKNQFNSMLQGTGTSVTHTLHFPSNMEATISTLTGYPAFGGTASAVQLLYDLPSNE